MHFSRTVLGFDDFGSDAFAVHAIVPVFDRMNGAPTIGNMSTRASVEMLVAIELVFLLREKACKPKTHDGID